MAETPQGSAAAGNPFQRPTTARAVRQSLSAAVIATVTLLPAPALPQLFDPYIIGMMAGPVSDGPSILVLKKRADKFMGIETLIIACSAGAVSGVVAHGLPVLAAAASGLAAPLGAVALAGTALFGCVVSAGAGATAIGTQWLLNQWPPQPTTVQRPEGNGPLGP